jgi:serine/threonine-protein kinase
VPDPVVSSSDAELRAHVERVLSSNYELDREIGRGGMGIVYKAKDRRLKRHVAIKLLPPELAFRGEIRSRFLKEAETAAQLSHPNIVPIYSVDERDGLVYFVMAFVDGENLAARIHSEGRLNSTEARRILKEVAEALAYAHNHGVVHRDIKPDNILLDGAGGRAMVTDFGIARAVTEGADSRLTATGMALGTPAYMSPEQSMGERDIDGRSDLYALGVVGYQMLAGELPFNASSTPALLVKQISERPTPVDVHRPDAPPDLARAIMLLLEKDPANRFPSAEALVTALDTGDVPQLPPSSFTQEPNRLGSIPTQSRDSWSVPAEAGTDSVTAEEYTRWRDEKVVAFRKKLAPFFAVSAVITVLAVFGVLNLMGVVGIWSVYLAYQYAKLWTDGFDWHDVFKQPRDRLFFDVVAESIDDFRALFDKKKRGEVLERDRVRARTSNRRLFGETSSGRPLATSEIPAANLARVSPAYAAKVRDAARHRDDILRLIETLPKREREQVEEVPATADALYRRIELLAGDLTELDRGFAADDGDKVDKEIEQLEAAANPLDGRSEERIRRLSVLRRKLISLRDLKKRRESQSARFENCVLALENMRYDVLKLKTGGQSFQRSRSSPSVRCRWRRKSTTRLRCRGDAEAWIRDSGVVNRRTS